MIGNTSSRRLAVIAILGLAAATSAQAFNMGNVMNPSKWMGGNNDRTDGPPPGYGQGYGPQSGYYGQPGAPGYGGYPGAGAYPQGYAPGPGAGPAAGAELTTEERILRLEQRVQMLEQELYRGR
jgi:hypothetical protein